MSVLLIGLLLSSLPGTAQAEGRRFPRLPVQGRFHGFAFSPGRPCSQGLFMRDHCREMEPKRWTPSEMDDVRAMLAPLFEPGRGLPGFLARVRANGYSALLRYSRGGGSAWTSHKDHSVNVADSLIGRAYPPDTASGFDLRSQIVLHELAHAFDSAGLAFSGEFLRLAGWRHERGRYLVEGVDPDEIQEVVSRFVGLIRAGDLEQAYRVNRDYGLAHGYPTAYAMTSPSECFAELVSHLYYDPIAERYLGAELVGWLRERVLR